MKQETRNINFVGILLFIVLGLIVISMLDFDRSEIKNGDVKNFQSIDELKTFLKENQKMNEASGFIGRDSFNKGVGVPSIASAEDSGNAGSAEMRQGADDYSTTNIQVKGVDEADVIKNDGRYIYNIAGNKVVITDAYPANGMKIISEIELKDKNIRGIFLNDDRLVVFAEGYERVYGDKEEGVATEVAVDSKIAGGFAPAGGADMAIYPYYGGESKLYVYIYDISSRENPQLDDEIVIDGNYANSRMIGDYIYVISSKYVNNEGPILPMLKVNGVEERIAISEVYYFDYYDYGYVFNSISAINVEDGGINSKVYMTGTTNNIYVSNDNIYMTYTKTLSQRDYFDDAVRKVILPILPESEKSKVNDILNSGKEYYEKSNEINKIVSDYSRSLKGDEKSDFDEELFEELDKFQRELSRDSTKTVVHKINIDEEEINYQGEGEVRGTVLNQFSMDEFNGNFRIATTSGQSWEGNSENNLYVLDGDLKLIGKLEGLAEGESIYSARFMGERAYLVTFKQIDPFYVVDLSNAENPKVLGYLKIPGYSNYLHPYDEDHIIGIGKDVDESIDTAVKGIKVSIFDVKDVENPRESAKIIVGERGTESNALYDHKAILFDKERNLLVLPISLVEIDKSKYNGKIPSDAYGQMVWQGAMVFDINLDEIKVRGKITHFDNIIKYKPASEEPVGAERKDDAGNVWVKVKENSWKMKESAKEDEVEADYRYGMPESDYTWNDDSIDYLPGGIRHNPFYDYKNQIERSLYIGDTLYTVSPGKIKANDLDDLTEISKIDLPFTQQYYGRVAY
ncbi:MAG: beta-propeller domain-containing protein [Nanoarchaeota archaeon]|nr:beta-propeller domain-containing protein [Nanoarchaeota archaeon]